MPWVRFWASANCSSGLSKQETTAIDWFDTVEESNLESWADEYAPSYITGSERGYRFGFEVLDPLPEETKLKLIKRYQRDLQHADKMLGLLLGNPAASRFDRLTECLPEGLDAAPRSEAASNPGPEPGSKLTPRKSPP